MSFWIDGDKDNGTRDRARGPASVVGGKVATPTQRLMMRASLSEQAQRLEKRYLLSRTWWFFFGMSIGATVAGYLYCWLNP